MILILFSITAVLSLVYIYLAWNENHWKIQGLPHNPPEFFFGNSPNFMTQKRNGYYDVQDVFKKFRGQYNIAGFFSLRKPTVLIMDASLIRHVFSTDFQKFAHNDIGSVIDQDIDPILGSNPFFLNGDEWKVRRAEITPAFTASRLRAMYPLIEDICKHLITFIDKESRIVGDSGIDARELSAKFTTDVVSSCIFSLDAGSLKDKDALIRKMGKEMFKPNLRTMFIFIMSELCPSLNKLLRIPFIPKYVEQFFAKIMREAAQHRRSSGVDKADVLQYLLALQEKKNLNDVEMVANAITFFLDGFETSSVAMSLILFEIARDQRVQEKLRREIQEAEEEGPLTMDVIADLPYLDQVVYEALRLNPPATLLTKKCIADCEMPLTRDGKQRFLVKAGTSITIPVLDIHTDPENYDNPLEFSPERFDKDRGGIKAFMEKGALLPFGLGPRMCLGQRFALTQMKAGLVDIVKYFEVSVNEKTKVPFVLAPKEFMYVPDGGIWVDFKKLE